MKAISQKFSVTQSGSVINVFHANKGEGLPRHEHVYSHLTMCFAGSCAVRKEGREILVTKDTQPINLVSNEWHEIEALEDGTIFVNVFAENKY